MLIKRPNDVASSEITDERLYLRRREFLQFGVGLMGAAAGGVLAACGNDMNEDASAAPAAVGPPQSPIAGVTKKMVTTNDPLNTFEQITSYNNFYEFGIPKDSPARYAGR